MHDERMVVRVLEGSGESPRAKPGRWGALKATPRGERERIAGGGNTGCTVRPEVRVGGCKQVNETDGERIYLLSIPRPRLYTRRTRCSLPVRSRRHAVLGVASRAANSEVEVAFEAQRPKRGVRGITGSRAVRPARAASQYRPCEFRKLHSHPALIA
jgi:hypothetical protein